MLTPCPKGWDEAESLLSGGVMLGGASLTSAKHRLKVFLAE